MVLEHTNEPEAMFAHYSVALPNEVQQHQANDPLPHAAFADDDA